MCVGGQFLSIVSELLSDRKQGVCLDGKVSTSVDVMSKVPLLFILHTSELFRIVENHFVAYADYITIYAVFLRLNLRRRSL